MPQNPKTPSSNAELIFNLILNMSKEQKKFYYEQLERLKENLISAEASTQI